MEGATPEQEQALAQFAAVTTCESAGTAKFFLESSGWDLQGAVDAYFTTGGQVPGEAEAEGMDDANDDDEDAEETSRNPPQNTRGFTVAAPADEEQRYAFSSRGGLARSETFLNLPVLCLSMPLRIVQSHASGRHFFGPLTKAL